ncbi:MAG: methyltransferase domain-containing protein [Burkholderiaceae bacterium]|nr:methyltransferase domain-containing protein [Burkholderiaceae bacterium]
MIISDLDFAAMYKLHMGLSQRPAKPASVWDDKALDLSARVMNSPYSDEFVKRMDLQGASSLLDVGCGPGTIALAVAGQLDQVHGLDYSVGMLACMAENAAAQGLDHVQTHLLAWEDSWDTVPVCDIVVASRSSLVADMAGALAKMTAHARLRCYMTHLVGGSFGGAGSATLTGRQQGSLPDYIYIINILYGMGLHPRIDYIVIPGRLDGAVMRWAFISWDAAPI